MDIFNEENCATTCDNVVCLFGIRMLYLTVVLLHTFFIYLFFTEEEISFMALKQLKQFNFLISENSL